MKLKVTPWFPPKVKPVYVGFYERDWPVANLSDRMDYWDGARWYFGDDQGPIDKRVTQSWRGIDSSKYSGSEKCIQTLYQLNW